MVFEPDVYVVNTKGEPLSEESINEQLDREYADYQEELIHYGKVLESLEKEFNFDTINDLMAYIHGCRSIVCLNVSLFQNLMQLLVKNNINVIEIIEALANNCTQLSATEKASTDFGIVTKYFREKGFGFVTRTFQSSSQKEIFFHIKNVKKTHFDLYRRLDSGESNSTIFFWYETVDTGKGEQVQRVLRSSDIHKKTASTISYFIEKVTTIWRNIDCPMPVWIRDVTVDLVGRSRTEELSLERQHLKMKKQEAVQKAKEEEQKLIEQRRLQEETEEKEFQQLVEELKPKGFTHSKQVSTYIVKNRLGEKYKHISGIVRMEQAGTSWNFIGGFPPKIYAKLCSELGLDNQGSSAKPVDFKPFKDL